MKKALLQIILSFLFFQQVLAAEEERDFRSEVRRVKDWEAENPQITFVDAPLPPLRERVSRINCRDLGIESLLVDGETLRKNGDSFEGEIFGEAVVVTLRRFLRAEENLRAEVFLKQGDNDPVGGILNLRSLEISPSDVRGTSFDSLIDNLQRRGEAAITPFFEGEIGGSFVKIEGSYSPHVSLNISEILYAINREAHETLIFPDLYVNVEGHRHYVSSPESFGKIIHNIVDQESERVLEDIVQLQGGVPHEVVIKEQKWETNSEEALKEWRGLERIVYDNIINQYLRVLDIIHVLSADLEEGVRYRRTFLEEGPCSLIYSEGEESGRMYATRNFKEAWRKENGDEFLVHIYKKGFSFPPRNPTTTVVGLHRRDDGVNIWPQGLYIRDGAITSLDHGNKSQKWKKYQEEIDERRIIVMYEGHPFWEKFQGFLGVEHLRYWTLVKHVVLEGDLLTEENLSRFLRGIRGNIPRLGQHLFDERGRAHQEVIGGLDFLELSHTLKLARSLRDRRMYPELPDICLRRTNLPEALRVVESLGGTFHTKILVFDMSWGKPFINRYQNIGIEIGKFLSENVSFSLEWVEDYAFKPLERTGRAVKRFGSRLEEKGLFGGSLKPFDSVKNVVGVCPTITTLWAADYAARQIGTAVTKTGDACEKTGKFLNKTSASIQFSSELFLSNKGVIIGRVMNEINEVLIMFQRRFNINDRQREELEGQIKRSLTRILIDAVATSVSVITPSEFLALLRLNIVQMLKTHLLDFYRSELPEELLEVLRPLRALRGNVYDTLHLSGVDYMNTHYKDLLRRQMGEFVRIN